jgi:predicted kinase
VSGRPEKPTLVVVTGPPAAGKSTIADALAARLGLPLIAKDPLKERLADALGTRGRADSHALGSATFGVLFHVLGELLANGCSAIAEGNFARADDFASLPPAAIVQVHVTAAPEAIRARLAGGRDRHPVHYDEEAADELAERAAAGEWGPLDLGGELVRVDTSAPVDAAALAEEIARLVTGGGASR